MVSMRTIVVVGWFFFALLAACQAAPDPPSHAHTLTPSVQPICGVPGYVLQMAYRFGKRAKLMPGETPIRGPSDMVNLGWILDGYKGMDYFGDLNKPSSALGPNYVFESDDLAIVARHDKTNTYGKNVGRPHITSGQFITTVTVDPPCIVEFMAKIPEGRGMWPGLWLYDSTSGKGDASEIDVMESVYNAPIGQRADRSKVFQFDHGDVGKTLADPGGLDKNGGWWQPYGSLTKGDPGSDLSKRWVAYSVWWQPDRVSKYVDNKLGITRAFKWTGPSWPNIIVDNYVGGNWAGPIFPDSFSGDNSTLRIKWIRVFKPIREEYESNNRAQPGTRKEREIRDMAPSQSSAETMDSIPGCYNHRMFNPALALGPNLLVNNSFEGEAPPCANQASRQRCYPNSEEADGDE